MRPLENITVVSLEQAVAAPFATRQLADLGARVIKIEQFLAHPQLAGRWREIGSPAGPLRAVLPPVPMSGVEPVMGDVPALGQHTDVVLGELGIGRDTIARWRAEGVV